MKWQGASGLSADLIGVMPLGVQREAGLALYELWLALGPSAWKAAERGVGILWPMTHSPCLTTPSGLVPCRGPTPCSEDDAFLYTLPDDSTHQLLQPHPDYCHLQEQPTAPGHLQMRGASDSPGMEAAWEPALHSGQGKWGG